MSEGATAAEMEPVELDWSPANPAVAAVLDLCADILAVEFTETMKREGPHGQTKANPKHKETK